jgi:hypothetical protein
VKEAHAIARDEMGLEQLHLAARAGVGLEITGFDGFLTTRPASFVAISMAVILQHGSYIAPADQQSPAIMDR